VPGKLPTRLAFNVGSVTAPCNEDESGDAEVRSGGAGAHVPEKWRPAFRTGHSE